MVKWTRTREDHDYWARQVVDVPGTPEASTSAVLARMQQYIESEGEVCLPCTMDLPCTRVQIVVHNPYLSPTSCMPSAGPLASLPTSQPPSVVAEWVGVSVGIQLDNSTYEVGLNNFTPTAFSSDVLYPDDWLGAFDLDGDKR